MRCEKQTENAMLRGIPGIFSKLFAWSQIERYGSSVNGPELANSRFTTFAEDAKMDLVVDEYRPQHVEVTTLMAAVPAGMVEFAKPIEGTNLILNEASTHFAN